MSLFNPLDYGELIPGIGSLSLTATTQAAALLLTKKVNVITATVANGAVSLPSSYAPGSEILTMNRAGLPVLVYPARGDQIEDLGVNVPLSLPSTCNLNLVSFDPPAAPRPHTWQVCYFVEIAALSGGLTNDGGWLVVSDDAWPSDATGLPAGAVWANGGNPGLATVVPGVTPDPLAPCLYFNTVSSTSLLAIGGGNLPLVNPGPGTNQLWNNGGAICIA